MHIADILRPESICTHVDVGSKKRALEISSELISSQFNDLDMSTVLDNLLARERLGSTGIGYGIAIPHCRLPNIQKAAGSLIILEQGIGFDSVDNLPVDIIFTLVIPEDATDAHLQLLATIAEVMHRKIFRDKLRQATDNLSLFNIATHHHDEY